MRIIINQDIVEEVDELLINSGSINYYKYDIEFDSSWDNLTKKAILINNLTKEAEEIAVLGNKIALNISKNGAYSIGFVGYTIENEEKTYQISTNLKAIPIVIEGAGEIQTQQHEIPTPTEWEIYNAQIQEFIREGQAVVDEAKMSGDYSKEQGTYAKEQGDYAKQEAEKVDEVVEYVTATSNEAKEKAETAESIAKGANQSLSFGDYATMISIFNVLPNDVYRTGQNILIVTLNVPDLWVSDIAEENIAYTYTTDEDLTNLLKEQGYIQVGYYKLSALETQKVDLTNYVKNTEYATRTGTPGVIRINSIYGIAVGATGYIFINLATNEEIDAKETIYKPITPANLVYAVGSVKASETQSGTVKVWTSQNEDGEIGLNISTEV